MITAATQLTDHFLDSLYPPHIQILAKYHWTPLHIAAEAARFLTGTGNRIILDIGSGVGKFCLGAASLMPGSLFFGIEQRKSLVDHAECAKKRLSIQNAIFIHGNFTQLDLGKFEHFYFYNAFYENLQHASTIDDDIVHSRELYDYYSSYLFTQLSNRPSGTRLCTLCSSEAEIPPTYLEAGAQFHDLLKFWIRE